MSSDRPQHPSEEDLNEQREIEIERETEENGVIGAVDEAFERVVDPLIPDEAADEEDLAERRRIDEQATREP
jgi:hypothetical protein